MPEIEKLVLVALKIISAKLPVAVVQHSCFVYGGFNTMVCMGGKVHENYIMRSASYLMNMSEQDCELCRGLRNSRLLHHQRGHSNAVSTSLVHQDPVVKRYIRLESVVKRYIRLESVVKRYIGLEPVVKRSGHTHVYR